MWRRAGACRLTAWIQSGLRCRPASAAGENEGAGLRRARLVFLRRRDLERGSSTHSSPATDADVTVVPRTELLLVLGGAIQRWEPAAKAVSSRRDGAGPAVVTSARSSISDPGGRHTDSPTDRISARVSAAETPGSQGGRSARRSSHAWNASGVTGPFTSVTTRSSGGFRVPLGTAPRYFDTGSSCTFQTASAERLSRQVS